MSNQQEQLQQPPHPQLSDSGEQSTADPADDELMHRLGEWAERVRVHLARLKGEGGRELGR